MDQDPKAVSRRICNVTDLETEQPLERERLFTWLGQHITALHPYRSYREVAEEIERLKQRREALKRW